MEDGDIRFQLGQISGQLGSMMTRLDAFSSRIERLEAEVDNLKQSRSWLAGVAAAVGVAATYVLQKLFGAQAS